jgi:hypothetical protein
MAAIRVRVVGESLRDSLGSATTDPALQYRHWDLCKHFGIPPFEVVTRFALAMQDSNRLPPAMVPPFEEAVPALTTQDQLRPTSLNTSKDRVVQMDISVEDTVDRMSATKRKQVLRPFVELTPRQHAKGEDVPPTRTASSRGCSEPLKAGSVPSKPSRPIVRVDSDDEMAEGVDFSGETYLEGSQVDPIRASSAKDQVSRFGECHRRVLTCIQICGYCREHQIANCSPTWYPFKGGCDIRCLSCVNNKKGCSFGQENFGIVKWPRVAPSEEGKTRRAKDAKKKRDAKKRAKMPATEEKHPEVVIAGEPEDLLSVEVLDPDASMSHNTDSAMTTVTVTTASAYVSPIVPFVIAGPSHRATVLQTMGRPTTTQGAAVPPPANAGQNLATDATFLPIWYADLVAIDRLVSTLSPVALEVGRSEVHAVRLRESNDSQMVLATIHDRRVIWEELLERLNARIEVGRDAQLAHEWLGGRQDSDSVASDGDASKADSIMENT